MSVPGSILSTPTTSGVASPTATASFAWSDSFPSNVQTCTAATVYWEYSGPQESIDLVLVPNVSPHTDAVYQAKRATINSTVIATAVDATASLWTWPKVNVSAGQYVLEAYGDGIIAVSQTFTIANGADTSCLAAASSTSSAGSTSATSSAASSSSSSATSSPTAVPVSAASSSHAKAGAIAGGVVGGLAIILAAIAAYVYFGLCRRVPTRSRRRAMDASAPLGKWGGLSSRDSGMDVSGGKTAPLTLLPNRTSKRATTESAGAVLSPVSSTNTRGGYQSSVTTLAGTEEDKANAYGHGYGYEFIESVPPLGHKNRRRSSASASTTYGGGQLSPIESIPEPPPSAGSYGRARSKSASQSHNRALALAKLDGGDPWSGTRPPHVPSRSVDMPPMAMPMSPASYDVGFVAPPVNRSSSGAGGAGARRAARKPVPALDSADLSPSPSPSPLSMSTSPYPPPSMGASVSLSRGQSLASTMTSASSAGGLLYRNDSQSSTTLLRPPPPPVGAPTRSRSREDLEAAGLELPDLNHKSSFGDRQVHYLIPDMPPPPRD